MNFNNGFNIVIFKIKNLLPKQEEEEEEITEEELIRKKYKNSKEISKILKENYLIFTNRFYKGQEEIELPKQS